MRLFPNTSWDLFFSMSRMRFWLAASKRSWRSIGIWRSLATAYARSAMEPCFSTFRIILTGDFAPTRTTYTTCGCKTGTGRASNSDGWKFLDCDPQLQHSVMDFSRKRNISWILESSLVLSLACSLLAATYYNNEKVLNNTITKIKIRKSILYQGGRRLLLGRSWAFVLTPDWRPHGGNPPKSTGNLGNSAARRTRNEDISYPLLSWTRFVWQLDYFCPTNCPGRKQKLWTQRRLTHPWNYNWRRLETGNSSNTAEFVEC